MSEWWRDFRAMTLEDWLYLYRKVQTDGAPWREWPIYIMARDCVAAFTVAAILIVVSFNLGIGLARVEYERDKATVATRRDDNASCEVQDKD